MKVFKQQLCTSAKVASVLSLYCSSIDQKTLHRVSFRDRQEAHKPYYVCFCHSVLASENGPFWAESAGGIYNLPSHLSPGARDLIPRMLLVDPLKRITIPEIRCASLRHLCSSEKHGLKA